MDRVFVLWGYFWASCGEHQDRDLIGVFSSQEDAQKIADIWKKEKTYDEGFNIEEFKLNDPELPIGYKGE